MHPLFLPWLRDGLAEVAAELAAEPGELDLSTPEEPGMPDLNGEDINALYLATAGLDASDEELLALGEALGEVEEEAILTDWAFGPPAPEPEGYDLAGSDWGSVIDLSGPGDDGPFTGACGPVDDLGYCRSAAHAIDCVPHSGVREADQAGQLPGGLTGAGSVLRDKLEGMSGVRLRPRPSPFGPAPRAAAGQPRTSPLPPVPAHIRAAIAAQRPELFSPSADTVRERDRDRAMDTIINTTMRTGGRPAHLGDGESPRERAERLRRPLQLRTVEDTGLPGAPAVRGYTAR